MSCCLSSACGAKGGGRSPPAVRALQALTQSTVLPRLPCLVAKRAIAAGEELTMCYVDEGMDVRARRAELLDYGFECGCARCEREAAGLGQARRGSKMK